MQVEFSKEECDFISKAMKAGVESAEAEITAFDKDAAKETVTAALVARSLMSIIGEKVDHALGNRAGWISSTPK